MKKYIILFLTFLLVGPVYAAPPSGLGSSSTFSHGQPFSVTGSNFGVKDPAEPLRNDTFDYGVAGQVLPDSATGWSTSTGDVYFSTTKQRWANQMSIWQDFSGTYARHISLSNTTFPGSMKYTQELFVYSWFNYETWGIPSRNVKQLSAGTGQGQQARMDTSPHTNTGHLYSHISQPSDGCNKPSPETNAGNYAAKPDLILNPDGQWHSMESFYKLGTDGYRDIWIDNKKIAQITGSFAPNCANPGIGYVLFGHYFSRDFAEITGVNRGDDVSCSTYVTGAVTQTTLQPGVYFTCEPDGTWDAGTTTAPPRPGASRYWDQLYVDITPAHVKICNASNYSAASHCEIQGPTAWANGALTFTAYQGAFTPGNRAWLYIWNADNEHNESGMELTLGEPVEDTTPPEIVSTSPVDGIGGIANDSTVTFSYSETVNGSSVSVTTTPETNGVVTCSGNQCSFPTSGQTAGLQTVVISAGVEDTATPPNATTQSFVFSYTTVASGGAEDCSYENWHLCKTQLDALSVGRHWWEGAVRTIPEPSWTGANRITTSDISGPWAGATPEGWETYSQVTESPNGASFVASDELHWPNAVEDGKDYIIAYNITPGMTGQFSMWKWDDETLEESSGTKVSYVSVPDTGVADHGLYFTTTDAPTDSATLNHIVLKEYSPTTLKTMKGNGTPWTMKAGATPVDLR